MHIQCRDAFDSKFELTFIELEPHRSFKCRTGVEPNSSPRVENQGPSKKSGQDMRKIADLTIFSLVLMVL